jgi:hypothetical protein
MHKFLTVFELLPKTCNFTVCSIFSNSGYGGWCTASPDTNLKLDTLVMIQTKFGFNWSSTFRGEDFWKSLRRTTKPNLVWIITRVSSFKFVSGDAVHQPTWPLLLKIEHMVKLQILGNNSKTVKVMAIAHMTLWVRWAKNITNDIYKIFKIFMLYLLFISF